MVRKTRKLRKAKQSFPGPNQCHPRVGHTPQNGCLPLPVLKECASKLGLSSKPDHLLANLAKSLHVNPKDQRTFLNSLPLSDAEKESLAASWLRPAMPEAWKEDPDMWLNSDDIMNVMKQYEVSNPEFKFLGPYPIDFASEDSTHKGRCLIGEMCSLDLDGIDLKGKSKIGIIYNLDPHDKGGSHWVANYINIPKKQCYYFDSYGLKPPKEIYTFMQWLGIQEPDINLGWNGRRFQYENSECGMYCMYFIDRMIAGESFLRFCRRAPPDTFMLDLRDWMFST